MSYTGRVGEKGDIEWTTVFISLHYIWGSHSHEGQDYSHTRCDAMYFDRNHIYLNIKQEILPSSLTKGDCPIMKS